MSKIVCDICGTSFSDTEERCPICGCAKGFTLDGPYEEPAVEAAEEVVEVPVFVEEPKPARFAAATKRQKSQKPVEEEDFDDDDDYDEDDDEDDDDYEDDDDDDDDDEEGKSNAPLVVALVIVILALIAVSAFIFVRYFMPNVIGPETTAPTAVTTTAAPEQTTEPTIPCENLALTSGGEIVLDMEGANWLINVMALPENTTDEISYASSDESVATVNEQGKVTAVGEGTAVITITCGTQKLECTVTVDFTPETTAPETTAPTEPEEETTAPTEPEETTQPTEPLKDIDLAKAINYKELTFNGPNQGVTVKINGLSNKEVKWSSEDENVATVDENGRILNTGKGTTYIVVQYGDQVVKIKIICNW